MEYTIKQISKIIGGKIAGNDNLRITGVSSIENAEEGDISFVKNEKLSDSIIK